MRLKVIHGVKDEFKGSDYKSLILRMCVCLLLYNGMTVRAFVETEAEVSVSSYPAEFPQNAVLLAGTEKVLTCAGGVPYRWIRYPLSTPTVDKVLFMGSMMADDNETQFRVYPSPEKYPFKQLYLHVTNAEASLGGTYRCIKLRQSSCAELIILDSEPKCRIHRQESDTTVQFRCGVNVTENGRPEMTCTRSSHDAADERKFTSCAEKSNGIATCSTQVPTELAAEYTCTIRIVPKPVLKYTTCSPANNLPTYTYTWESSTSVNFIEASSNLYRSAPVLGLLAVLGVLIGAVIVSFVLHLVNCSNKTQKEHPRGRAPSACSAGSDSTECVSLDSVESGDSKTNFGNLIKM